MGESPTSSSPREHLSSLLSLVPRAIRATWIGGIAFAIGLGGTVAWTLSTAHLYRSEAVLAMDHGVHTATLGGADHDSPRETAARVKDALTSRQRLEKIIEDMNLYRRIAERQGTGAAIDEMQKHIIVSAREEYAYRVSYDANQRELAQKVLETLIKSVLDEDSQRRLREAEDTKRFLDIERAHADEDLKTREAALSAFIAKHPSLASETGGGAATAGGVIRAADRGRTPGEGGALAALEVQAAELEGQLAAAGVRVMTPGAAPPADPTLLAAAMKAQGDLTAARQELTDKQARFTNEHPDVKAALRHVAIAEAALHRAEAAVEADRAAAAKAPPPPPPNTDEDSPSSRTSALKRALAAVRGEIAAVKSRAVPRIEVPEKVSSVVAIDTEWTRLNRDVSEARERQINLEGKQFQAELMATLASGGYGGRLIVIDPPFRPVRPITGGRLKIASVGLAASIMLSLLTIVLFAAFDDRLYGERDLQRLVKDGIVVAIPKLTGKSG
jgi:hypothetical protein